MWVECCGGFSSGSDSESVYEVVGGDGVEGPDVEFAGCSFLSGFGEVFYECSESEHDPSEVACVEHSFYELVHVLFPLGEFFFSVFLPEAVVSLLRHGVGVFCSFSFEFVFVEGGEVVVAAARVSCYEHVGEEVVHAEFGPHVVAGEAPFSVFGGLVVKLQVHVSDVVYLAFVGYLQFASSDAQAFVLGYPELSLESEVLVVVGIEEQVVAAVVVECHGVHDGESVEADGSSSDGAGELVLEDHDEVVVEVYVFEEFAEHSVGHLSGLQEGVHAFGPAALDEVLGFLGFLSVEPCGEGLVHGEGHDVLVVQGRGFDLVGVPLGVRGVASESIDVVHGEGDLLIAVVAVVVVRLESVAVFSLDDAPHEFHGGVVFAAVFPLARLDADFAQGARLGLHACLDELCAAGYLDRLGLVSHAGDLERPPLFPRDAEVAQLVGEHGALGALVSHAGALQKRAVCLVFHLSLHIGHLRLHRRRGQEEP